MQRYPQEHTYGFSPLCTRMCLTASVLSFVGLKAHPADAHGHPHSPSPSFTGPTPTSTLRDRATSMLGEEESVSQSVENKKVPVAGRLSQTLAVQLRKTLGAMSRSKASSAEDAPATRE